MNTVILNKGEVALVTVPESMLTDMKLSDIDLGDEFKDRVVFISDSLKVEKISQNNIELVKEIARLKSIINKV